MMHLAALTHLDMGGRMTIDELAGLLRDLKKAGIKGDSRVVLDVDLAECHSDRNILDIVGGHIEDGLDMPSVFVHGTGYFLDAGKHI